MSSKSQVSNTEVTPSETLVNEAEFAAEFTDDEIDADVCFLKLLRASRDELIIPGFRG
jgi:hypothetical protein